MIIQAIYGNGILFYTYALGKLCYDFHFYSPSLDLRGLNSSPERSTAVTFHAIIPQTLWEWNATSHMHIRFEGPALGNWKHNVGEFKQSRWVHNHDLSKVG